MITRPPLRTTPLHDHATPDDCPLMRAILNAAQQMFPGDPWEDVEPHMRRARRSILEPTPWEEVRDWMRASWMTLYGHTAANDGDGAAEANR